MPLALVSFAIGLLMFEKIRTRTSWTTRDRVALCLVLTAAMFVKGPIVWAFVLPPLVIYQLRRKWRPTFPNAWSGWIPWVASLALFYLWLMTWALSGIVVMSLIPSKRVDRIFPAVPPLCMLLAAQIKASMADNVARVRRIAACAIIFASIFTGAYSAMRVIDGYLNDRDA